MINKNLLEDIILKHYDYLKGINFQGWDVLDGLNSRMFQKLPFHRNKYLRLCWIQFFRRSPINLRKLTLVPKEYNPKALALFISGLLNLYKYYRDKSYLEQASKLYNQLLDLKAKDYEDLSWGYNFDWQAIAFYVPKFKPNMVCSIFGGHTLLDLFEVTRSNYYLDEAQQVSQFILNHLKLVEAPDKLCFAYIPGEPAIIHNVNMLGAAYLSRLHNLAGLDNYQSLAEKSIRFSVGHQREDGAWSYGNQNHHVWIDNFHTGYNLVSIHHYQQNCNNFQFEDALIKGLDFHLKNHFTKKLLPKYSDRDVFPLDVHCFAQALITFIILKEYIPQYEYKIKLMLNNVLNLLWDKKHCYFWYKKSRLFKSKIPYIRWSQAWMFYALTYLLAGLDE